MDLIEDFEGLDEASFQSVTLVCGLPKYLNKSLFERCGGSGSQVILFEVFKM